MYTFDIESFNASVTQHKIPFSKMHAFLKYRLNDILKLEWKFYRQHNSKSPFEATL
jgi:hypothetical protein